LRSSTTDRLDRVAHHHVYGSRAPRNGTTAAAAQISPAVLADVQAAGQEIGPKSADVRLFLRASERAK